MALIPANTIHFINRREVLRAGTYLLAFAARPAWAQDTSKYTLITPLFNAAREVLNFTVALEPENINGALIKYLDQDYYSRGNALSVARQTEIFSSVESATNYVRKIPDILPRDFPFEFDKSTQDSQIEVIKALTEYKLPIVPPSSLVTPQSIPSLEPGKVAKDEDIYVLIDILLETLGLTLGKEDLIVAVINSDPSIKALLDNLLEKVTEKKWNEVAPIIEGIFKSMIAKKLLGRLSELLARKVAFNLGLKAVPVIGWIYLCAAFIISVRKNYHRLSFA
ncbi:MAG TPA: hypothetical protein VGO01_25540 [Bradyrhizobium sp.]|jgi:hypothetical protein|nr:hypothetical protein [Bradyrhizobium sp.]